MPKKKKPGETGLSSNSVEQKRLEAEAAETLVELGNAATAVHELLAGLVDTVFLASAFGPHPEVAERARLSAPQRAAALMVARGPHGQLRRSGVLPAALLRWPAAVGRRSHPGGLASRTMMMMMMMTRSESAPVGHVTLVAARFRMERPRSVSKRIYLPLALAGPPGWGGGAGTANLSPATMPRK